MLPVHTVAAPQTPKAFVPAAPFLPHGVAFIATLVACVVAAELRPFAGGNVSPILLLAVVVSAWYGGFGPGLLSTILGVLAFNYFFQDPPLTLSVTNTGDAVQLLVFSVVALFISWLTTSRKQARVEAANALYQALHDPVTGLPNRVLLEDRLNRALAVAKREKKQLALLLINLDGARATATAYGHHFADAVLQAAGRRMYSSLRDSDTLARLDGDDFAVLVPEFRETGNVSLLVDKLLAVLGEPLTVDGKAVAVRPTFGIALFPDHGQDSVELVDRADGAVVQAKQRHTGYAFGDG
ncbi:MAG: diguanylate cyclase [Chloroflexi bacterium]|nr:diguanylate cyclase [Chloroflexota bacterium]